MFTDFAEEKILNILFGRRAWSGKPTTLYLSAMTSVPTDTAAGTEPSGNGYARVAISVASGSWEVGATERERKNVSIINFGTATAAWGTVQYVGLHTAASGGSLLAYIQLPDAREVAQNTALKIAAGELVLRIDGDFSEYLAGKVLDYVLRGLALPDIPTFYLGLGTSALAQDAPEGELAVYGYARLAVNNNSTKWATWATGAVRINGNQSFAAVATGKTWANLSRLAIFDAALTIKNATVDDTTNVLTTAGHGYVDGDQLFVTAGTMPGGLTEGVAYYVRDKTTDTYKLEATLGGGAIDITSAGANVQVRKINGHGNLLLAGSLNEAMSPTAADVVTLAASSLSIALD